ncbi:MAG: 2Fe-2S iron-sulfur cluster binding domain-containing protein [Hyphomicrobiales bacterium]|nr:2Fe-2S iron-sulfur cluster binding domain-containing protein [Hyphomicrobiales bacterium]
MASGLVLFTYIGAHLVNHALGLISLAAAEHGLELAIEVWYSRTGTVLLYGAALTHFLLALWAVYDRRTFRLPPAELVRIALGFTLPIILIGHAANTRLAWELFELPSDYKRVVSLLLVADSQGWQLGLMAPGWLHGCLGLQFAFQRRAWFRRYRFLLFSFALLLPVMSAVGFLSMGKELGGNNEALATAREFLGDAHIAQREGIERWRNGLLGLYLAISAAAFAARTIRNVIERGGRRLISISFPTRTVQVPRGWTVLEASRSFHLPHASMCGGRARCSTCRVRVAAGEEGCPPPQTDEQGTLKRIEAPSDVRLACQLRPTGNVSVIPLVQTERPIYRQQLARRSTERDVVVMICDFLNRADLAANQLPQDLLYVITLYAEALGNAIRGSRGTLSYIEFDSICAVFGLETTPAEAARQAMQAARAIELAMTDLNRRFDKQWHCRVDISVSIHAGRAAVGEVGTSDPPTVMAIGEAMDTANALRDLASQQRHPFAITQAVFAAAELDPGLQQKVSFRPQGRARDVVAFVSPAAPALPPAWTAWIERQQRRAALRRLWSG